jgi:hypothetical protein
MLSYSNISVYFNTCRRTFISYQMVLHTGRIGRSSLVLVHTGLPQQLDDGQRILTVTVPIMLVSNDRP